MLPFSFQRRLETSERAKRTWVLGGGGARGAAQVGVLQALFEVGLEPPRRLVGVSVGALNAATLAAYPSRAGAAMLRELWFSRLAQDVFRLHPLGVVLNRLRGDTLSAMPATNVTRLIERAIQLIGIETFEDLRVPLEVLATDIGAGRPHVFRGGRLLPALRASTAIPASSPRSASGTPATWTAASWTISRSAWRWPRASATCWASSSWPATRWSARPPTGRS